MILELETMASCSARFVPTSKAKTKKIKLVIITHRDKFYMDLLRKRVRTIRERQASSGVREEDWLDLITLLGEENFCIVGDRPLAASLQLFNGKVKISLEEDVPVSEDPSSKFVWPRVRALQMVSADRCCRHASDTPL